MIAYRKDIDGLRALAIASVVIYHTAPRLLPGGYVGVDIFFVISGFLITGIILSEVSRGQFSFVSFYARRCRRIIPAAFVMLGFVTVGCFAVMTPEDLISYGRLVIYTTLFGANFRLAGAPSYFSPLTKDNPLLHMWSLSVEEQFYIVWPLFLTLGSRFLSGRRLFVAILTLLAASFVTSAIVMEISPRSAFYHLPSRAWELMAGALIATGSIPVIKSKDIAEAAVVAGLLLIGTALTLYGDDTPFPGIAAILPVLGAALIIHAQSESRTSSGAVLSWQPSVLLGRMSYSLYLWHWPILALTNYFVAASPMQPNRLLLIAIAGLVSALSWAFVELPFRQFGNAKSQLRPAILSGVSVAAILVFAGSYAQESKGAVARYGAASQTLLAEPLRIGLPPNACETIANHNGLSECRIGKANGGIIVWGDSHAGHFFPAIAAAAKESTLLAQNGCVPIPGFKMDSPTRNQVCESARKEALHLIKQRKPKLLILASAWNDYQSKPETMRVAASSIGQAAEVSSGLTRIWQVLDSSETRVIFVPQIPKPPFNPRKCLSSSMFGLLSISHCLAFMDGNEHVTEKSIEAAASDYVRAQANTQIFDSRSSTCHGNVCDTVRDGHILYFDDNHLTVYGASLFVDAFSRALAVNFKDQVLNIVTKN